MARLSRGAEALRTALEGAAETSRLWKATEAAIEEEARLETALGPRTALTFGGEPLRAVVVATSKRYTGVEVETRDGVGVFVGIMRDLEWMLVTVQVSSYNDFPHVLEFRDRARDGAVFATATFRRTDGPPAIEGWFFELVDSDEEPIYQQGSSLNRTEEEKERTERAVRIAREMVMRSGVAQNDVELLMKHNNQYVMEYEEAVRKGEITTNAAIGANAWGFNPLGTEDFDKLVEKAQTQHAGQVWIVSLKGKTLRKQVSYNRDVQIKVSTFACTVRIGNYRFIVAWDWGNLSTLAYNARYSPGKDAALDDLARERMTIANEITAYWKPNQYYGGYDRVQMSESGLRRLAQLWRDEDVLAGIVKVITAQEGSSVAALLERPAAQRSVGWGLVSGIVESFGGEGIRQLLGPRF